LLRNEASHEELEQLSEQIVGATQRKPELATHLRSILNNVQRMKVAKLELEELRTEHYRGDITEDMYLTRRKKLRMDLVSAKDEIQGKMLDKLIESVKEEKAKSMLAKAKEAVVSHKDLILFLTELLTKILPKP